MSDTDLQEDTTQTPSPSPASPTAASPRDQEEEAEQVHTGEVDKAAFKANELRYFRKMFDMFDTDHSGAIGFFEMKNLTKHLGVEMDDAALKASMEKIDENGNGDLEFDEFVQWLGEAGQSGDKFAILKSKIRAQGTRPLTNVQIQRLNDVFNHFDTDGSGSIDIAELGHVFVAMGQPMAQEDLEALMKQADDDGSGEMEFEEFLLLMCSNFGVNHAFDQDLLEGFHKCDPLKTGVVSCADLAMLIRELVGPNLTTDEIDEVVDVAHTRGDGYIEYMRWESLWDACRGISF